MTRRDGLPPENTCRRRFHSEWTSTTGSLIGIIPEVHRRVFRTMFEPPHREFVRRQPWSLFVCLGRAPSECKTSVRVPTVPDMSPRHLARLHTSIQRSLLSRRCIHSLSNWPVQGSGSSPVGQGLVPIVIEQTVCFRFSSPPVCLRITERATSPLTTGQR